MGIRLRQSTYAMANGPMVAKRKQAAGAGSPAKYPIKATITTTRTAAAKGEIHKLQHHKTTAVARAAPATARAPAQPRLLAAPHHHIRGI